MECSDALELISARLDNALTGDESALLDAHLAICPECRALLADFETVHAAMPGLSQAPAGLSQQIMEQVHQSKVVPMTAPRKRPSRWKAWASTAAVLALVVAGAGVLHPGSQPQQPADPDAGMIGVTTIADTRSAKTPAQFALVEDEEPQGPFCGVLVLPEPCLSRPPDYTREDGTILYLVTAEDFTHMAERSAGQEGYTLITQGEQIDPEAGQGLLLVAPEQ